MPSKRDLSHILAGDVVAAARSLLGCRLLRQMPDGRILSGRIVETEAYHQREPGCHAYRGRTARTEVMFGQPGLLYVYLIYGIHHCANVVCEADGVAAAVLLRALEPEGNAELRMSGPGLLCRALDLNREHNGAFLLGESGSVFLRKGAMHANEKIVSTRRVGLSVEESLAWRFHIAGNPHVSRGRPSR